MSAADSDHAERWVWVFTPDNTPSPFTCGVWADRGRAEKWIREVGATGTLSTYVLNESAYDSNVRLGRLRLDLGKVPRDSSEYKRVYTTALDHFHFKAGERA